MLANALSSSHSAGWQSLLGIQQTFNTWVRVPGRFFVDKACAKGNLFYNLNVDIPFNWKFDQDALTISPGSELYPTAGMYLFWAWDSFCVVWIFWLPYYISKSWGHLWLYTISCPPPLTAIPSCFQLPLCPILYSHVIYSLSYHRV